MTKWVERPLGSVATLQRGFDLPHRERNLGTVPIVTSAGVGGFHSRAIVRSPGVVTGRYGTIGRVFFIDQDFWPLNTTLWVSNFHGNDERFIYYLLQRVDFATHSGKSGVPGVNRNDLHGEMVSLPMDLSEQRTIANTLSGMDTLLSSLEQLIVKKRDIKQGLMQELLTGHTRLPGFSEDVPRYRLGELASFSKGSGLPKSVIGTTGDYECVHYGELFLQFPVIAESTISRTDWNGSVRSRSGDVLMPTSDVTPRGLAKATALMATDVVLGGDILVIRIDQSRLDSRFLAYAIRHDTKQVLDLVRGTTVYHLYASDMHSFGIAAPSIEEQQAIVRVLQDADAEITALERRLESARAIKQGMMQELLTGHTRLLTEVTA